MAQANLDVALWCDDHTLIQVDIINGFIDVDEDGALGEATDDLFNCDLNDETAGPAGANNGIPQTNQVDILNGCVDVNENAVVNAFDDAFDIQLFNHP